MTDQTVIQTGKTAFLMGIPAISNPYRSDSHLFKLWKVGFNKARKEDDRKKLPNGRYRQYLEPLVERPYCIKCSSYIISQPKVEESYCNRCGDYYKHTEFEFKEEK